MRRFHLTNFSLFAKSVHTSAIIVKSIPDKTSPKCGRMPRAMICKCSFWMALKMYLCFLATQYSYIIRSRVHMDTEVRILIFIGTTAFLHITYIFSVYSVFLNILPRMTMANAKSYAAKNINSLQANNQTGRCSLHMGRGHIGIGKYDIHRFYTRAYF